MRQSSEILSRGHYNFEIIKFLFQLIIEQASSTPLEVMDFIDGENMTSQDSNYTGIG